MKISPNRIYKSAKCLLALELYRDRTDTQLSYEWTRIRKFHGKTRFQYVTLEEICVYRDIDPSYILNI